MHGRFRLTVLKAAASGAVRGCRGGCRRGKLDVGVVHGALHVSPASAAHQPESGDARWPPRARAFHESLDVAERDALLDMVRWLHAIVQSPREGA